MLQIRDIKQTAVARNVVEDPELASDTDQQQVKEKEMEGKNE
jgi:hypothetical protein